MDLFRRVSEVLALQLPPLILSGQIERNGDMRSQTNLETVRVLSKEGIFRHVKIISRENASFSYTETFSIIAGFGHSITKC